jgi:hypothetical protein
MSKSDGPTLPDGWEIIARHGNYGWVTTALTILSLGEITPGEPTTTTWAVRQRSTGDLFEVTASTEREAMNKIANGQFDAA